MPTDAELFATINTWDRHDTEHRRTNPTTYGGTKTAPLRALYATHDLIESLAAGRWHMITAARLGGATWDEIARAMNHEHGAKALRQEYAGMVDWYATRPSIAVDIERWRAALAQPQSPGAC